MISIAYPNQKIITVQRTPADRYYTKLSNDCIAQMQRDLTTSEFAVQVFLLAKIPDSEYALSPQEIANQIEDLSVRTIRDRIIPSLVKKGYITQVQGNRYKVTDYSTLRPSLTENDEKDVS